MFTDNPLSLEIFRPEDVQLYAGLYTYTGDKATDKAAALALLEQLALVFDSTWSASAKNGGIRETTTTTGITSVLQGVGTVNHPEPGGYLELTSDVVLTLPAWEDVAVTAGNRHIIPVVSYLDNIIPLSDIKYIGDGNTAEMKVVVVDNTGLKYGPASPVAADWQVYLHGPVIGAQALDLGGLDLPTTIQKIKVLGVKNSVINRTTQDGASGSGSFEVLQNKARMNLANGIGATPTRETLNNPGQDLIKIINGTSFVKGSRNELGYLPTGKRLVLAAMHYNSDIFSVPMRLDGAAADIEKVFAWGRIMYNVDLTGIDNLSGESADATDPIKHKLNVTWDYVDDVAILTR